MADPARIDDRLSDATYPKPAATAGSPVSADPSAQPPDLPGFTQSPAQLPETVRSTPIGEWPTAARRNPNLERAATAVGGALGTAVTTTKRLPEVIQGGVRNLRSRLTVVGGRAHTDAKQKAEELKDEASQQVRAARVRVQHIARESPAAFIGGVAAIAFVTGVILGIWRENSRV